MKELSNWGRWGEDDELGASNLITPDKRRRALALGREGVVISLARDVPQETDADVPVIVERELVNAGPTGATDRYRYTGTYHGAIHTHLDALNCHVLFEGQGYNGRSWEEIERAGGCPRGHINALKDGIVTRAVLFDATLLPNKAAPQGWVEPGTAITREDLLALERIENVRLAPGDVMLLYTGRWKRRAALGPSPEATGFAGYHVDVAYLIGERDVAFIGADGPNEVVPGDRPKGVGSIHQLASVAMGVGIFDNLDLERAAAEARRLKRYEFLFVSAPLRIEKGTGSPLNPIAVF